MDDNLHKKDERRGAFSMHPVLFEGGLFAFNPLLIEDFNPTKSVATCYIVCNLKILLLKRNNLATAGNTWCMPAGKEILVKGLL